MELTTTIICQEEMVIKSLPTEAYKEDSDFITMSFGNCIVSEHNEHCSKYMIFIKIMSFQWSSLLATFVMKSEKLTYPPAMS